MSGERLHRFARHLVREDTYRLMVAPAIADLCFEAPRGRMARMQAYVPVGRALASAFADDLTVDASAALTAMTAPPAMRRGLCALAVFTIAGLLNFFRVFPIVGPRSVLILYLLPSAITLAALPALTIAAHEAAGRVHTTRGFLALGIGIAALMFVSIDQGVTRTNMMFREVESRARGLQGPTPGPREMSVVELLRVADRGGTAGSAHANAFRREPHFRVAAALSCIPYLLFGLALVHLRLQTAAPIVFVIVVAHIELLDLIPSISRHIPLMTHAAAWLPLIVLSATAIAAHRSSARERRAV
jgi:hypothetical protein